MKITPLDIGSHRFPRCFRGFDPKEVELFLEMVRQEMEDLVQENRFLSDELRRKSHDLSELKEQERLLKDAMLTAQKVSDEMKSNLLKEAQLVIAQAEMEADHIIRQAHDRVLHLQDEVRALKDERVRLREELRCVLRTYSGLLDAGESKSLDGDAHGIENTLRVMPSGK